MEAREVFSPNRINFPAFYRGRKESRCQIIFHGFNKTEKLHKLFTYINVQASRLFNNYLVVVKSISKKSAVYKTVNQVFLLNSSVQICKEKLLRLHYKINRIVEA